MYSSYQEQFKQYRQNKETQNQKKQLEQLQSMEFEHEMPYFTEEEKFKSHIIDNPLSDAYFEKLKQAIENFEKKIDKNNSHRLTVMVCDRLEYARNRCIYYIQNTSADNLSIRWQYYQDIIGAIQSVERILTNLKERKKTLQLGNELEDQKHLKKQLEELQSIQFSHEIISCNTLQEFTEKIFNKGPDSLTPFMKLSDTIESFKDQLSKNRVLFEDNTFRILQFNLHSITNNVLSYLNQIQGINNPVVHWEVYKNIIVSINEIEGILKTVKTDKKRKLELIVRKSNNNNIGIKDGKQEVEENEAMENSVNDDIVISIDSFLDSLVPTETTPLVVHAASDPNENIVCVPVFTDLFNKIYKRLMDPTVSSNQNTSEVSYLDILSDEILVKLLKFLPLKDRCNLAQTCRRFVRLCKDNSLSNETDFEQLLQNMSNIFNMDKYYFSHFSKSEQFKDIKKKYENNYPQFEQILLNIKSRLSTKSNIKVDLFLKLIEQLADLNMLIEKDNLKKYLILSNNYLFYQRKSDQYRVEMKNIDSQIAANKFKMNCCGISSVIASALSILLTVTLILSDVGKRSPLNDPVVYAFAAIALLTTLLTVGYVATKKLHESIKNYPHNSRLAFFSKKLEQTTNELNKIKPYFFDFKVEHPVETSISFAN